VLVCRLRRSPEPSCFPGPDRREIAPAPGGRRTEPRARPQARPRGGNHHENENELGAGRGRRPDVHHRAGPRRRRQRTRRERPVRRRGRLDPRTGRGLPPRSRDHHRVRRVAVLPRRRRDACRDGGVPEPGTGTAPCRRRRVLRHVPVPIRRGHSRHRRRRHHRGLRRRPVLPRRARHPGPDGQPAGSRPRAVAGGGGPVSRRRRQRPRTGQTRITTTTATSTNRTSPPSLRPASPTGAATGASVPRTR